MTRHWKFKSVLVAGVAALASTAAQAKRERHGASRCRAASEHGQQRRVHHCRRQQLVQLEFQFIEQFLVEFELQLEFEQFQSNSSSNSNSNSFVEQLFEQFELELLVERQPRLALSPLTSHEQMKGAGSSGPFRLPCLKLLSPRGAGPLRYQPSPAIVLRKTVSRSSASSAVSAPDLRLHRRAVAAERDDLHQRRALLDRVEAVGSRREEREVDVRCVGVGVDDAGDAFEGLSRPVERRHEQAAPARRRADGPVIVELARRARLPRVAGDLVRRHDCSP